MFVPAALRPIGRLLLAAVILIAMPQTFAVEATPQAVPLTPPQATPSGMYTSIRDAFLGDNVFPTAVEGLRRLGINAIELNLSRDFTAASLESNERVSLRSDDEVKAFRQRADKLGVRVCSVMTACDFSAGDMDANIAWIARAIEIADLLGASCVRVDSAMAKEKELDFETRVRLFVDGLGGAIKRTPDSKVTLGIENHGFQGNNLAFLLNVFQQVNSDRLGSTLDLCNFYWRGYPLSEVYGILRVLAPYAKHAHVKSIRYPAEQREVTREPGWEYAKYACPLDEGDIDLAKVVAMLRHAGYRNDICLEDESLGKCPTPAERAAILERDVAHIRRVLDNAK